MSMELAGLVQKIQRGPNRTQEAATKCKWLSLVDHQVGGIAFEWREREAAGFNEPLKTDRRSNADVVSSVTQTQAKRDVGHYIAARTAGEEGDGFHGRKTMD